MVSSILSIDFDLISGSSFTFWDPNGLFLRLQSGSKTIVGSTHVVKQLLSSIILLILAFDFYFFWVVCDFLGP